MYIRLREEDHFITEHGYIPKLTDKRTDNLSESESLTRSMIELLGLLDALAVLEV